MGIVAVYFVGVFITAFIQGLAATEALLSENKYVAPLLWPLIVAGLAIWFAIALVVVPVAFLIVGADLLGMALRKRLTK